MTPKCCGEVITNTVNNKEFYYCRGCKKEVDDKPPPTPGTEKDGWPYFYSYDKGKVQNKVSYKTLFPSRCLTSGAPTWNYIKNQIANNSESIKIEYKKLFKLSCMGIEVQQSQLDELILIPNISFYQANRPIDQIRTGDMPGMHSWFYIRVV